MNKAPEKVWYLHEALKADRKTVGVNLGNREFASEEDARRVAGQIRVSELKPFVTAKTEPTPAQLAKMTGWLTATSFDGPHGLTPAQCLSYELAVDLSF